LLETGSTIDVRSLSFLENRKLVASYSDGTIRIWDSFKNEVVSSFQAYSVAILTSSALDWNYLATSSYKDIHIWDIQNGSLVRNLTGHSDYVYHMIKIQKGLLLSASADKTIKVWNMTEWSLVNTIEGHLDSVNFLVELNYDSFASGSKDGEINIWSVNESTINRSWKAHTKPIISLALLHKQRYLASLSKQGQEIKIWDFIQGKLVKILSSDQLIYSIVVLKNGDLVSASDDGHIHIWDGEEGTIKKSLFYGPSVIWCLASDYKGRLAVGMGNGEIRIFDFLR